VGRFRALKIVGDSFPRIMVLVTFYPRLESGSRSTLTYHYGSVKRFVVKNGSASNAVRLAGSSDTIRREDP